MGGLRRLVIRQSNCFTNKTEATNNHVIEEENGAPEEIRTPDPQIRSLVLYPAELRVRVAAERVR